MPRFLWVILSLAAATYLGLLLLLYFMQSRLLFFPRRELLVTPDAAGIPYESVSFTAADGAPLHGWFVPAPKPRATVLFCHGNGGNISYALDVVEIIVISGLGRAWRLRRLFLVLDHFVG